jgi:hypothetical protein
MYGNYNYQHSEAEQLKFKKFLELLPDSPERRLLVRMVATQRFSLESFTQEAIQRYLRALFMNSNYRENVGFAKALAGGLLAGGVVEMDQKLTYADTWTNEPEYKVLGMEQGQGDRP